MVTIDHLLLTVNQELDQMVDSLVVEEVEVIVVILQDGVVMVLLELFGDQ